jgi:hypothetical protein
MDNFYKSLAKVTLLSICLIPLIYMLAGPLSLLLFECADRLAPDMPDIGGKERLCEIYRPFFLLELVTSTSAARSLMAGLLLSCVLLLTSLKYKTLFCREISLIGISLCLAFSVYYYFSLRTLSLSNFENQESNRLLKRVEFKLKCPWRSFSCFNTDTNPLNSPPMPDGSQL